MNRRAALAVLVRRCAQVCLADAKQARCRDGRVGSRRNSRFWPKRESAWMSASHEVSS